MPKLSVLVTCYNQEKFIEEALESILKQTVLFDYEIVISDDFSQDKTPLILQQYQIQYPDKIRLLPSTKNLGITKNLQKGLQACKGEYIAILEGDDYWTSPHKLQMQVAFLEQNPACSLVFNGLLTLDSQGVLQHHYLHERQIFEIEDLIHCNFIGNFSTCMYRAQIIQRLPPTIFDLFTVDWMFNISMAQFGSIGFIPQQMTVYRRQDQGCWSKQSAKKQTELLYQLIKQYDKALDYSYHEAFLTVYKKQAIELLGHHWRESNYKACLQFIKAEPQIFILSVGQWVIDNIVPPLFLKVGKKISKSLIKKRKSLNLKAVESK